MKACDVFVLYIFTLCVSMCATVSEILPDMTGATKVEMKPIFISTGLGDTVVISAPIINNTNTVYYLSNPKGDSVKLNINASQLTFDHYTEMSRPNYGNRYNNEGMIKTVIIAKRSNFYQENNCIASDCDKKHSDFTIGPLTKEDHGNWVLSAYYKGDDGHWRELFQVITIEIVDGMFGARSTPVTGRPGIAVPPGSAHIRDERYLQNSIPGLSSTNSLPTYAVNTKLIPGQIFEPRFLYPIDDLQSCEISTPRTTFDRFYDRDRLHLDSCGFRIPNVSKYDEGPWGIIGVGKIVYKGDIYLEIDDKDL